MQYFVIGDDGQKYGPADLPTLNAWVAEGRLLATTTLEDSRSGVRMLASAVPGLQFGPPAGGGYQAPGGGYQAPGGPQFGTSYPRQQMGDDGAGDVTQAWVFAVMSFFCCPFLFFFGFAAARRAMQKGNPGAQAAKVANIVSLSIWFVLFVIRMILGFASFSAPQ